MESPGLFCSNLNFAWPGNRPVLDGLQATFAAGRPALVTGPTGSGKSTLLHLLGALLKPTGGEIQADGRPVSRWSEPHREVWRRRVGMVFQHLHLVPDLTVLENVLLPFIPRTMDWADLVQMAGALLDRLDLASTCEDALHMLSGGQRQRVALARALVGDPAYLLLDEPTSFQDDSQTRSVLALLSERADQGACVVVCSHDMRLREGPPLFACTYRLHQGRLEGPA